MTHNTNTPADYAIQFRGANLAPSDVTVQVLRDHLATFGETIDLDEAELIVERIRDTMREWEPDAGARAMEEIARAYHGADADEGGAS